MIQLFKRLDTRKYLPISVEGTHPASEPVTRLEGCAKRAQKSVANLNYSFLIVSHNLKEAIRMVSVPPLLLIGAPGGVGHHFFLSHMWGPINKLGKPMNSRVKVITPEKVTLPAGVVDLGHRFPRV